MKKSKWVGMSCVFMAAVVFGYTPVLANLSYAGGNNGVNMAFLRAVLPLPLLVLAGRITAPGFKATASQIRIGALLGCLNFGCTQLLYSSYSYIPVGIATTLHFLYPLFVVLYHIVFCRERPGKLKLTGLVLGLGGAISLVELGEGGLSPFGMLLALLSSILFAAYIVLLQKEAEKPLPLYWLMVASYAAGGVLCAAVGLSIGKISFALTPRAWLYVAAVALLASFGGSSLFQVGVRHLGDADAAIYSLLEPLTSILFGIWLLGEVFSPRKAVSCALILAGLLVTAIADRRQQVQAAASESKVL